MTGLGSEPMGRIKNKTANTKGFSSQARYWTSQAQDTNATFMEQWSNLKSPIPTPPLIVLDLVSLFPTFEIVWPLATVTLDQEKFKKDTSRLKLLVAEWNSAIIAASSQDRARGHELEYTKTLISTFNCRCRNLVADNKMAQKTNNSIDIDMEHLQFSQCLWDK